jgi:hypothetical protein
VIIMLQADPKEFISVKAIELDSFDYTHVHRTAWNTNWKEDMHLRLCVPGMLPTRLRVANDNKVRSHG